MKTLIKNRMALTLAAVALLGALTATPAFGRQGRTGKTGREQIELGRGMSLVAPNLIEIGMRTNMFLLLADRVQMTAEQKSKLEEIMFDFQRFATQKQADYDVADAELTRLLTRDTVDMGEVRAKVRDIEALNADLNVRKYEALLKAIGVLTHEQHLKVVALGRTLAPEQRPDSGKVY